jgi:hypothetical protein
VGRTTIAADGSADWAQTRYGNAATLEESHSPPRLPACTFSCDAFNAWECFKNGRRETSIRNVFLFCFVNVNQLQVSRETLPDMVTNTETAAAAGKA